MIFCSIEEVSSQNYIVTSSQNVISRSCNIQKPETLEIPGGKVIIKNNVTIRGDIGRIQINKYTMICEDTSVEPCKLRNSDRICPLTINSHCYIGKHCLIQSASIGVGCQIGDHCVLSPRTILKDFVLVLPNTIVPPDMVIPPFSVVGGQPGRIFLEPSHESAATLRIEEAETRFKSFRVISTISTTKTLN